MISAFRRQVSFDKRETLREGIHQSYTHNLSQLVSEAQNKLDDALESLQTSHKKLINTQTKLIQLEEAVNQQVSVLKSLSPNAQNIETFSKEQTQVLDDINKLTTDIKQTKSQLQTQELEKKRLQRFVSYAEEELNKTTKAQQIAIHGKDAGKIISGHLKEAMKIQRKQITEELNAQRVAIKAHSQNDRISSAINSVGPKDG